MKHDAWRRATPRPPVNRLLFARESSITASTTTRSTPRKGAPAMKAANSSKYNEVPHGDQVTRQMMMS
nr:hypothetical protein CFP56_63938 [Quercus suber]